MLPRKIRITRSNRTIGPTTMFQQFTEDVSKVHSLQLTKAPTTTTFQKINRRTEDLTEEQLIAISQKIHEIGYEMDQV